VTVKVVRLSICSSLANLDLWTNSFHHS